MYYDAALDRPVSTFVPAENLVVPYETSNLETCPIITHVVPMSENDLRKQQISGFYRDIELRAEQAPDNEVRKEINKIDGTDPSSTVNYDVNLLEFHVELDLEGFEDQDEDGEPTGIKLPYIVTLSEEKNTVLSVRRNYRKTTLRKPRLPILCITSFYPD